MNIRPMFPSELEAAVGVWRDANIARGAPHDQERTARVRTKLSAEGAMPFVALRPGVVGMALAERGRHDGGSGDLDPTLLHISMMFVRPEAQRTGIGRSLLEHVIEVAREAGHQRVDVWTAEANHAGRKLYEGAGMALTGKQEPGLRRLQVQYVIEFA